MNLNELATTLGGKLILKDGQVDNIDLTGVGPIEDAKEGLIAFLNSKEYEQYVATTKASCLITSKEHQDIPCAQIIVKDAYAAFAVASQQFFSVSHTRSGISPKAFISETATVSENATLYPNVYIDEGATVEEGAVLYPGVFVGRDAKIGKNSVLRANVVVEFECVIGSGCLIHGGAIIGADGFGFAPNNGKIEKIPQTGNVVIGDDVELGAGCSVDRATMGSTIIGEGSKIDSYTQIGHNVRMGKHNIMCGGSGMAGSSSSDDFVVIGGGSNIANHVNLSTGVRVGAKSVVTKSLTEPGDYCGFPAIPMSDWRKQIVHIRQIPKILSKLKELAK
ncbi:UDP-3-O-(3-hydroxymyristoyl)glucosamine N-acyltransferase [bacterium]|nr:UDP-3-O-(3-hydroxymyristoyl)glucosamine N-acyltransferase [bacterium]